MHSSNSSAVSVCLKNRVHIWKYTRKYLFGTVYIVHLLSILHALFHLIHKTA